jgi:hypothetical protein
LSNIVEDEEGYGDEIESMSLYFYTCVEIEFGDEIGKKVSYVRSENLGPPYP